MTLVDFVKFNFLKVMLAYMTKCVSFNFLDFAQISEKLTLEYKTNTAGQR